MKTKFKFLTVTVATLLVGLTSCSNSEDGGSSPDLSTPKTVRIKISTDAPSSYSEGVSQGAAAVDFSTGDVYMTNAAGVIKSHYTIGAGPTSTTNIDMGVATGAGGETLTNVPGDVTAIYIVGNTAGLPTAGSISAVKAKLLQVQSQVQTALGNNVVNLYGDATLTVTTPPSAGVTGVSDATITITPTVARIELTDMTATGAITGYEVAGIFIDNYYSAANADGSVVAANFKSNNGAPATDWVSASTIYPATLTPSIYDWYATALPSATNVAKPTTAGQVWGYNVFAAPTTGSAVPTIIIRLKNVTATAASGLTFPNDQFITVKGFNNTAGGGALTAIKQGEVYTIAAGALTFDETDITGKPYVQSISVGVKVSLAQWKPVGVTPQL